MSKYNKIISFILLIALVTFLPIEAFAEEIESNKDCNPSKFMGWFDECLFCHLFKTVYNAASYIAYKAYNIFAIPVSNVLVIGAALWMAFKTLPFLATLKSGDARDFIMDVLKQLFLIAIIIIFLKTSGLGFFDYIMEPIFNTGFALAKSLLDTGTSCAADYGILKPSDGGGLPASMGNSVVCVIEQMQLSIAEVLAIGMTSTCVALFIENGLIPVLMPDLSYLLTGLLLTLGGFTLLIAFPFLVLDSVLQLCVAAALLPFAMACYPFEATKSYAKKVWDTFLTTVYNFVFLSLVVLICVRTIKDIVQDTILVSLKDNVIDGGNFEAILETMGWESVLFMKVVFMFVLSYVMLNEVQSFSSEFASAGGTGGGAKLDMAKKAGGTLASGATNMAKKTVLKGAKTLGRKAIKTVGKKFNNMRMQQRANTQRKMFGNMTANMPEQTQSTFNDKKLDDAVTTRDRLQARYNAASGANKKKLGAQLTNANQQVKKLEKEKADSTTSVPKTATFNKKAFGFINVGGRLGTVTLAQGEDGKLIRTETSKSGKTTTTKEYGYDEKGRSTRSKSTTKENKKTLITKLENQIESGAVIKSTDQEGNTTYEFTNKKRSVVVGADGSVTSHRDGWLRGKRSKEINDITKLTARTRSGVTRQTIKGDHVTFRDNEFVNDLTKKDGTADQDRINNTKKELEKLEADLKKTQSQEEIKSLKEQIAKEKEKVNELIATTLTLEKINPVNSYMVSQRIIPDKTKHTMSSTASHDSYKVENELDKGKKGTKEVLINKTTNRITINMESQNQDDTVTKLKTDDILQKVTNIDKKGNEHTKFALKDFGNLAHLTDPNEARDFIRKRLKDSEFSDAEKLAAETQFLNTLAKKEKFSKIDAFK